MNKKSPEENICYECGRSHVTMICPYCKAESQLEEIQRLKDERDTLRKILESAYEESATNSGIMSKRTAMAMFKYFNPVEAPHE